MNYCRKAKILSRLACFILIPLIFLAILKINGIKPNTIRADVNPGEWNMAGANPRRTSWVDVDIGGVTGIEWYRPIEPYIQQKTQIVTANKKIYVSTTKGLLVMDAETGGLVWRFDTELPLGHSPTVAGDMVYIGGYDRKFYALRDLGSSFEVVWVYTGAGAGFSENPLVVDNTVYIGNRDGYFYSLNAATGSLNWKFPGSGQDPLLPILVSPAYDETRNLVYFASMNMRAYALNATTGTPVWFHNVGTTQVAGSDKLPGERVQSWWPVVYKDSVIFSTAHAFQDSDPGADSLPEGDNFRDGLYPATEGLHYSGDISISSGSQGWDSGVSLLDSETNSDGDYSLQGYLTNYPSRKTTIALNADTGEEITGGNNPPYTYSGTTNGSRSPPIISPDGEKFYNTNTYYQQYTLINGTLTGLIPSVKIMGWQQGNQYLSLPSSVRYAVDEPSLLSGAGNDIMVNLCCDRIASIITRNRDFWAYPGTLDAVLPSQSSGTEYTPNITGRYDPMWQLIDNNLERLTGYYKGNTNTPNGNYASHGLQNPLVPYRFTNSSGQVIQRLFTHRSNTIVALGVGNSKIALTSIDSPTTYHQQASASTLSQSEMLSRLENEIDKMVTAWEDDPQHRFLNPGYYNNGQWFTNDSFPTAYFDDPADTVLALSKAYQKISNQTLKTRLLSYLQQYVATNFVNNFYVFTGWQGVPRDEIDYPPEIASDMANTPASGPSGGYTFRQKTFYALWKYTQTLQSQDQQSAALTLYNASQARLNITTNPNAAQGWTQEQWHHRRTWEVNEYIAAYQGFLNLQALALNNTYNSTQQTTRTNVQNALSDLLTLRSNTFYKDTLNEGEWDNPSGISENLAFRKLNFARNFMFMIPELADSLNSSLASQVQEAVSEYTYLAPLWFVSSLDNDFKESAMRHLYDAPSLFSARAEILNQSQTELSKYVDIPAFSLGDLFYISNLTLALDAPTSTLNVENINPVTSTTVGKFEKFEISFDIANTTATNFQLPYDASAPAGVDGSKGISVNVQFSPDNWQTIYTQPAFYYQVFDDQVKNNNEWFYPTNTYQWRARFSPHTTGTWKYRVIAQDSGGVTQSAEGNFTVINSSKKGFIKVSSNDPRYFEYSDGTYFPGLGYNKNFDDITWVNPTLGNETLLEKMSQNKVQLARIWLSQWSIYGSSWNPWHFINDSNMGIPASYLTSSTPYSDGGSETSMIVNHSVNPCMFIGWLNARPAVKQNTNYRVRVRYKTQNISGPRVSGNPYGLVVKISNNWLWDGGSNNCNNPNLSGTTVVGTHISDNTYGTENEWQVFEGNWNSGTNNFLPYFYLVMDNVNVGRAFIDYVWLEEDLGSGNYGPNLISKPWMSHHLYFEQRNSYAFDKLLDLAEDNDVYFKMVMLEKDEWILNRIKSDGTFDDNNPTNDNFYGDNRDVTKTRWLEQAWWRYAQARWGYSPNIHSWELLNEGDPASTRHFALADEFGEYMHQFTPNSHLVTTSTWHSFPASGLWGNSTYPNLDYADVHHYIPQDSEPELFYDSANASSEPSNTYRSQLDGTSTVKPIIRGETGFTSTGSSPSTSMFINDTNGVWLHNYLWAGLNSGGMMESYWYVTEHIDSPTDKHSLFNAYYKYIYEEPLTNGHYVDTQATVIGTTNVTVLGQKDTTNNRSHFWIRNNKYTWCNAIGSTNCPQAVSITPENATIQIGGFTPNLQFTLEKWDTWIPWVSNRSQQIGETQTLTSDSSGVVELSVTNLTSEAAYKLIGSETVSNQSPTSSFTATPNSGTAPLTVNFNGTASSDSDGTIVAYLWTFGDGETGVGSTASHTYDLAGVYTARLTVTDDDTATHYTETTITVTTPPNQDPVAVFIADPSSGTAPLTVNFNGSNSSDSDGSIISYSWNFGDGQTGTGVTTVHTFSSAGNYTVRLTVTDDDGGTNYSQSSITVSEPPNIPPVSSFTVTPSSGNAPLTVNFNSTASSDTDGTITSYAWNFGDGNSGTGSTTTHTYTNSGNYTARLTVTDNDGDTHYSETQISVSVPPSNSPPTSSFTATPSSGYAPLSVIFNGTASSDTDGTITSYAWNFGDGTTGTGVTTTHTFSTAGNYTVRLTVTDDDGDTHYSQSVIQVSTSPPANQAPSASFTASSTSGYAPLTVNFNASGSTDTDGTISSYAWNFGDTTTGTGVTTTHTFSSAGNYTVRLTVTDDDGATHYTETLIQVQTEPANQSPVASFTATPTSGTLPLTVVFNGTGSTDTDGTINSYSWTFGDNTTGVGSTTSHIYQTAGVYTARLTVTDNDGATHYSQTTITVNNPPNQTPFSVFTISPSSGLAPLPVFFDASDSYDPDGTITAYSWTFGDNQTGIGRTNTHTYITAGIYTARLMVTDNREETGYSETSITVTAPTVTNQNPTAALFAIPTSGNAPLTVSFDASGSTDSDGSISSYYWVFGDGTTGVGSSLSHTYTEAGTFTAQVTVTDDDGATNTMQTVITVNSPPDDDGDNEEDEEEELVFDDEDVSGGSNNSVTQISSNPIQNIVNSIGSIFTGNSTTKKSTESITPKYEENTPINPDTRQDVYQKLEFLDKDGNPLISVRVSIAGKNYYTDHLGSIDVNIQKGKYDIYIWLNEDEPEVISKVLGESTFLSVTVIDEKMPISFLDKISIPKPILITSAVVIILALALKLFFVFKKL